MERNINLNEITDGKLYGPNDMVKADCGDCMGCSACCRGMGSSIVVDPYDLCRLSTGLSTGFEELLKDRIELNVVDGIILPNLLMAGAEEKCSFLDADGRCMIHSARPGICRLFPLGRLYEDDAFRYFLQTEECANHNRTKTKVKKWIDTPDIRTYEKFIVDWHYFLKELQIIIGRTGDEQTAKSVSMYILENFYMKPYAEGIEGFYVEFYERLDAGRKFAEELKKTNH